MEKKEISPIEQDIIDKIRKYKKNLKLLKRLGDGNYEIDEVKQIEELIIEQLDRFI